jgi:hypothetical protein
MVHGEDEHKDAVLSQELEGMPVNSGACLLDLNLTAPVSMLMFLFDINYYSTSMARVLIGFEFNMVGSPSMDLKHTLIFEGNAISESSIRSTWYVCSR